MLYHPRFPGDTFLLNHFHAVFRRMQKLVCIAEHQRERCADIVRYPRNP